MTSKGSTPQDYRRDDTDLSAAWKAARPTLYGRLRRAGASHSVAEDLLQEVALRIVAKQVPIEDIVRWGTHVGRQLLIDEHRRAKRIKVVALDLDVAGLADVADAASAAVDGSRAWATLDLRDRDALTREDLPNLYVRRHRARARLDKLLGPFIGGIIALRQLRSLLEPRADLVAAMALVVVMIGQLVAGPSWQQRPSVKIAESEARSASAGQIRGAISAEPPNSSPGSATRVPQSPKRLSPPTVRFPTHAQVVLVGPDGQRVAGAGTEPAEGDRPLLCVQGPAAGRICVARIP